MGKIQKYASRSTLMDITIELGQETFKFNLNEELAVTEASVQREILEQASSYAFVGMLHKKLLKVVADRTLEVQKTWAKSYTWYKGEVNDDTGKPYSDDYAKQLANLDKDYLAAVEALNNITEKAGVLGICVKAFEARKDLIQTISANIRKDKS